MKPFSRIVCLLLAGATGCAYEPPATAADPPRLVVVITVDQMRDDYLDRFGDDFTGGFRRLLNEGRRYKNTWVDHAPTNSFPGHASIASGALPRHHGFVDNSWKKRQDGEWIRYYTGDEMPHDCDAEGKGGVGDGMLTPALGERFLASGGKFVALSAARDMARIYAGAARAPVYWMSVEDRAYISSSCHQPDAADWIARFNEEDLPAFVKAASPWALSLPDSVVSELRPDDSSFEGEGAPYIFPHNPPAEEGERFAWFYRTPAADESLLALAEDAIEGEGLGDDDIPDLINIVINTIDETGHRYGPFSVENVDNLFRLDRALGAFMESLDASVGEGRWMLVLTADHGAPPAPEAMGAHPTAQRVSEAQTIEVVNAAFAAAAAYPDDELAARRAAAAAVAGYDFVDEVFLNEEMDALAATSEAARLHANAYIADRPVRHPFYDYSGASIADLGLTAVLKEYVVVDWATSVHGSPYDYDRRVPVVFYGAGVSHGSSERMARTIDIAPTLMGLIGVGIEDEIDGVVLPVGE